MSNKSNAAPVRDWLMKKYEKALRTIFEQNDELGALKGANERLREHITIQQRTMERFKASESEECDALRRRIAELSIEGRVRVFLTNLVEDARIELITGTIASAGGQTQISVELPQEIGVGCSTDEAQEPRTMLSAVTDALASEDFKKYSESPGTHPQTMHEAPFCAGYPQGAISAAFHC